MQGVRYSARIDELRGLGYVFEKRPLPERSTYRYWMTYEPGVGALLERPLGRQPEGAYTQSSEQYPHEVRVTMNGPTGRFTVIRFVGDDQDGEPDTAAAETAAAWRWHDHYVEGVGLAAITREAAAA